MSARNVSAVQTTAPALAKTILFMAIVPGTVLLYVPYRLLGSRLALPPLGWPWLLSAPLVILAVAISARCAWDFAAAGRGTPAPYDPPKKLVVRGPYRYVRNPMYVAATVLLLGEAILFRSRVLLIYTACAFAFYFLFVVLYEEPTLRHTFGEEYEQYCRAVPRWLPRLRRRKS